MENYIKKMVIDYIKKNIGNYTDIQISNYSGKVTGVMNYPHSKQTRQRVFIGWDNEFLAYIKERTMEKKVYGVEVWHGTTAVYCDMFESLEESQAHVEWCKANAKDGWYRVVYGPYQFESRHEFAVWQSETEGMR